MNAVTFGGMMSSSDTHASPYISDAVVDEYIRKWIHHQAMLSEEEGISYKDGVNYACQDFIDRVKSIKKDLIKTNKNRY